MTTDMTPGFTPDPDDSLPWPADDGEALRQAAVGSIPGLSILGKTVRHAIAADALETFDAPPGVGPVTFSTDEFSSMCPVTEQPDTSTVTIRYLPAARCVESKSLKLYLWSFRDRGVFCEGIATEIADAVARKTDAWWTHVTVEQAIRGGIATTAECTRTRDDYEGATP